MTTNDVVIRTPDGETDEYRGVLFAEEGVNPESGTEGVALQFRAEDPDAPKVTFVDGGEIVSVYDDVARERPSDTFLESVDPETAAE